MPYENLTASLSDADVTAILTKIGEIKALLPFAIGLTPAERSTLPKITDQSSYFVEDALAAVESQPDLAPRYLDLAEMKSDLALWKQLDRFVSEIKSLARLVDDTAVAAGSEAYTAALSIYNSAKRAAKDGVPGAQAVVNELKRRFDQANRSAPAAPAA